MISERDHVFDCSRENDHASALMTLAEPYQPRAVAY
jgi:hypothetical protein